MSGRSGFYFAHRKLGICFGNQMSSCHAWQVIMKLMRLYKGPAHHQSKVSIGSLIYPGNNFECVAAACDQVLNLVPRISQCRYSSN